MSSLPPLENFDCDGDPSGVGLKWERWKRGLNIYLEAANIDKPEKKRATLLHMGGLPLQEIYYNIPGAHVDSSNDPDIDVYQIAVSKLNEYFAPKQSRVYERHIFRLMKQETGEKFEKFLIRLRKQADRCKFSDKDESLIDQITEKCSSVELRKKILQSGDSITLDTIIQDANTLESVTRQLDEFGTKNPESTINKVHTRKNTYNKSGAGKSKESKCFRCGNDHIGKQCPALSVKCNKCGKTGHYARCCKTERLTKRSFQNSPKDVVPAKKPRQEGTNSNKEEVDYVFHLDDDSQIKCILGGVETTLLIDSGSTCNLLTDKTWNNLKGQKIEVHDQVKSPNKVFLAYGSKQPLVVIGSFKTMTKIQDKTEEATFYVIKDGTKDLLGKVTAIALGVLHIGPKVQSVLHTAEAASPFPKFKNVLIEIPVDTTVKPVSQPYRRVPIPLEQKINDQLQRLMQADIIEKVQEPSKWVSPMVPVLKENGEVRICIDMRRANTAINRENHPLPTMDQLLPNFKKAKLFSRLDIKDAFHQIEIHPDSRHITTFITSKGLFRYKRLMFGISCAPEIFQKTLESILAGCEGTVNFIDDIIIFGSDDLEHDKRLQTTLKTLEDNDVLLNPHKCLYKIKVIQFLGHELSPHGVKPLPKYVRSIQDFRAPSTLEELQSFLGLVNYVGKWIPNLATQTEPLRKLLRLKLGKNANIARVWTQEQEKSFNTLKSCLSNIKTLGYYDPADKTQVIADASPVGLGAVLIQTDSSGSRIVAYGNKSLSDCEKRYCQTEKEALALVWAVEHFNIYLYGKEFELVSDHKPLEVIFGRHSKPCARIERWVLRLQSYNYKIIYRPGKSNIADPLSRLCVKNNQEAFDDSPNHVNQIVEFSRPVAVPLKDIERCSEDDDEISKVKQALYQHTWDPSVSSFKIFETELCFQDSILLRGNKIVIPNKLRQRVLEAAHEGHPGIVAMKNRLRSKVWWPKIDKEAEQLVKNCKGCTLVSAPNPPNPMKRRELPAEAWVDVAMDLMGPLPSGDYIFVVIDYYSRYKEIKTSKNITSADIIKMLKEIFSRLGFPRSITADNGKQFSSDEFRAYLHDCGITLYNTIPYWPQQNGEVERQNRSILKRIKISQLERKNWKEELFHYLMMYNSTPNATTGKTPSELFYRRQFRDKIPCVADIANKQSIDDSEVRDKDKTQKDIGKNYSDRKRKATEHTLQEGDKVYTKNLVKENELTSNFSPASHTITKTNANTGDVEIRNDETGQQYRRNIIHLKKVEGKWTSVNKDETDGEIIRDQSNV